MCSRETRDGTLYVIGEAPERNHLAEIDEDLEEVGYVGEDAKVEKTVRIGKAQWHTTYEKDTDLKWKKEFEDSRKAAPKEKREKRKRKALGGVLEVATKVIERNCPDLVKTAEALEEVAHVATDVKVGDVAGLDALAANANAGVAKAGAYAKRSPAGVSAGARAAGPEAGANAILLEGVVEANSKAVAAEAEATAGVTLENLGAKAEAHAVLGKVAIGIKHTPLKAHAQGPSAGGEVGISWDYTGGNVGISAGEARAGPFAVRAGVKFGAGIRNGVPEVDLGPVTAPCCVM